MGQRRDFDTAPGIGSIYVVTDEVMRKAQLCVLRSIPREDVREVLRSLGIFVQTKEDAVG